MSEDMPDFSNVQSGSSSTATKIYEVVSGDSLSKIAKREYGDANKWRAIYEANRDLIKDPDIVDGVYDIHWLEKHLGMK